MYTLRYISYLCFKENVDDSSDHLESFKLQVSMLNNQVDILLRKLNHLEKYLMQQNDLRKKAESKLHEVNIQILYVITY